MVRVSGSLRFVTDNPAQVSEVWVRAPRVRTHAGGVVTTGNDRFPVDGGEVSFTAVPGPAVLALISQGRAVDTIPILVPERDASLEECVRAAGDADEYSRRELEQMVLEVREYYPKFGEVAKSAWEAASEASSSASSAASSARAAGVSAEAAGEAESAAAESARGASTAESNAKDHASTAARHEVAARGYAGDAETSAESAREDADRAATIAGSTRWVGTQVEVNGTLSPDLMPTLEVSPQGTWVINGVDTGAQARGPGGASAWEDISGKPQVFPPAEHTHNINDLEGTEELSSDLYSLVGIGISAAVRNSEVADPAYVDQQVGVLRAEVTRRPALFSGYGPPPPDLDRTQGAGVGDWYVDLSTAPALELHIIKGVS